MKVRVGLATMLAMCMSVAGGCVYVTPGDHDHDHDDDDSVADSGVPDNCYVEDGELICDPDPYPTHPDGGNPPWPGEEDGGSPWLDDGGNPDPWPGEEDAGAPWLEDGGNPDPWPPERDGGQPHHDHDSGVPDPSEPDSGAPCHH